MKNKLIIVLLVFSIALKAQTWQHMGPFCRYNTPFLPGRADVVCTDPGYNNTTDKTIYLGSTSGGFWKTTNAGVTWQSISMLSTGTNMHYGGISAMAIENNASPWMYIADYNPQGCSGVYKYQPSSGTWQNTGTLNPTAKLFTVHNIQIHPANKAYVYACTNAGLFLSTNSGTSWSQVLAGDIYNVAFMHRTGTSGLYPYYVYAIGMNEFAYSQDDGNTYLLQSCVMSEFSHYATVYGNIALTVSASNPGVSYIYMYCSTAPSGSPLQYNQRAIFRFSYNSSSNTENCDEINGTQTVYTYSEYDDSPARLAITADDQMVYVGGVYLCKYNALLNQFSYVISYNSPKVTHTDQHYLYYNSSVNQIFIANDGGFEVDNYTPANSPDNGEGTDNVIFRSDSLDISQVSALSCSQKNANTFAQEDLDENGFVSDAVKGTTVSFGDESSQLILDQDKDSTMYFVNYYGDESVSGSTDLMWGNNGFYQGEEYESTSPSTLCNSTAQYSTSIPHMFGVNFYFQNPNRVSKIYFGTITPPMLNELCNKDGQTFIVKNDFSHCGVSDWFGAINSMGFSAADTNLAYLTIIDRYWPGDDHVPQIFKFVGNVIDTSFIVNTYYPCNDWKEITPSFSVLSSLVPSITMNDVYKTWFPSIAVSDWDTALFWVPVCDAGISNGNMPDSASYSSKLAAKLKVLMYNHGVWTDYSAGIPLDERPLYLVYEKGTNDQMYLGTNRAIYYRGNGDLQWNLYSTNLPIAKMTQLQVEYSDNTIRAGTYGYGVWKNSLHCPSQNTLSVNTTITSSSFYEAEQSVTVQNTTLSAGYAKFRSCGYIDFLPNTTLTASSTAQAVAFIHNCSSPGNSYLRTPDLVSDINGTQEANPTDEDADGMQVYPNPNAGSFTIKLTDNTKSTILIYNILGEQVFEQDEVNQSLVVNLENRPKGVYFVKAISNNGSISVKKVVLQ